MENIDEIKQLLCELFIKNYRIFELEHILVHYEYLFGVEKKSVYHEKKYCIYFDKQGKKKIIANDASLLPKLLSQIKLSKMDMNEILADVESQKSDDKNGINDECLSEVNYLSDICETISTQLGNDYNIVAEIHIFKGKMYEPIVFQQQNVKKSNLTVVDNKTFKKMFKKEALLLKPTIFNEMQKFFCRINISKEILVNEIKTDVKFGRAVISEILNIWVLNFYANNICDRNSVFSLEDIDKKIFEEYDLISSPFRDVRFDAEGISCEKKYLVKNGILKNILSNSIYSKVLNVNVYGDADLFDPTKMNHQRLILKKKHLYVENDNLHLILEKIVKKRILDNKTLEIVVIGKLHKEPVILSCKINIHEFLNSAKVCNKKSVWYNNVLCQSLVILEEDIKKILR